MDSQKLITELIDMTKENMNAVQSFKDLSTEQLNQKPAFEKWSILECIEHLNRYGDYYIPEIKQRLSSSKHVASPKFKAGLLGNYFAKSMLPKEKLNKMKTFKSMNPVNSSLDRSVLDKFIHQQESMLEILKRSRETNLTKVKTSISISKLIKLRLGDTLQVVIFHNKRHVTQAHNVIE